MAMAIERDEEGKHCPVCGNFFYRKTEFCSDDCFFKFESRKKICPICGKNFYARIKNAVYCSDICKARKNRDYHIKLNERREQARRDLLLLLTNILEKKQQPAVKKEKPKRRRVVHEPRICPVCGKSFVPVRSTKKCCSSECAQIHVRAKSRTTYKRVCPQCGKEFETTNNTKKFCTIDCGRRHAGQKKTKKHARQTITKAAEKLYGTELTAMHIMQKYRKECPICGRGFYTVTGKEYCSQYCENADF